MKVGTAQRPITPSLERPVFLAGFGRNRPAQQVHDDLWVRALAISDGGQVLVLAAADLLGLGRARCLAIQDLVRDSHPAAETVICCTHTHHGPDTIGFWGPDEARSGVDPQYMDWLQAQIASACSEAIEGLSDCGGQRAAAVEVPGVAKNHRDPHILDIELTCLQFCRPDGRVQATLAVFPCHPEVLHPQNTAVSSDYPHSLRREIESVSAAPCLFFAGALGGMMSPAVPERTFEGAAAMGAQLADAGLQALARSGFGPAGPLQHALQIFEIPLTNPLFREALQAGLLADLREVGPGIHTEVRLIRIGDIGLVTVPGELFPVLGLAIKAELRAAGAAQAAVIGLANDELGYILPQAEFHFPRNPADPGDHYEETMSVGPQAGPRVMAAARALIAAGAGYPHG